MKIEFNILYKKINIYFLYETRFDFSYKVNILLLLSITKRRITTLLINHKIVELEGEMQVEDVVLQAIKMKVE